MSRRNRGRGRGGRPTLDTYQAPRFPATPPEPAEDAEPADEVPVFYIGEKAYTIPADLPPAVGLRYLKNVRYLGPDAAAYELLVDSFTEGEAAYDVLAGRDDAKRDEIGRIVDMVIGVALGAVDPGKGSSSEQSSSSGSSTT